MRNLKRVLSLALATAMLFGMMVMGASAAEDTSYTDQNSISNKEAVAVMSAIGVFQGADGKFNPTGALTRESAAKIITYMVMGKAAADDLSTSAAPYTDVAANRWSAGSVAYCAANGIISGDGAGNFYPELTVNGYAFAKMLLGALGYKASTENMTGNGWESNVAKLVNRADLKDGISAALSKDMTRDDAARMAFNAIQAKTVSYSNNGSITGGDFNIDLGGTRTDGETFMKLNFSDLTKNNGVDDFGRPGNTWKFAKKEIGTYGKGATTTFTADTELKDVKSALDGATINSTAGIVPVMNDATKSAGTAVKSVEALQALTENGRAVEVYVTDGAVTDIVVVDSYLYTISNINTVSKSVSFKGTPILKAVTEEDQADLYNALVDMGKDAKVLVNADNDGVVLAVAEPETVSGSYTANNSKGRTIGGEKYKDSFRATGLDDMNYNTVYTAYLDSHGYLLAADEEEAVETKTALVKNVDYQGGASSGLTFLAQLVFTDGTTEWVEVSKVNDTAASKIDGFADFKDLIECTGKDDPSVVEYSLKSDGTYAVSTLKSGTLTDGNLDGKVTGDSYFAFTGLDVNKNKSKFFSTTVGASTTYKNIEANSKTIFLVEKDSGYSVYTGVKNVPNLANAQGTVVVADGGVTATLVVIKKADNVVDSSSLVYIAASTGSNYDDAVEDTVFTFDAIVKGVAGTLTATTSKDTNKTALKKGLYTASFDDNGYATALKPVTTNDLVVSNNYATVSDGTIKLWDSKTEADKDNGVASANLQADDKFVVFIVDKDNGVAEITSGDVAYYEKQESAIVFLDSDKEFATTLIVVEAK